MHPGNNAKHCNLLVIRNRIECKENTKSSSDFTDCLTLFHVSHKKTHHSNQCVLTSFVWNVWNKSIIMSHYVAVCFTLLCMQNSTHLTKDIFISSCAHMPYNSWLKKQWFCEGLCLTSIIKWQSHIVAIILYNLEVLKEVSSVQNRHKIHIIKVNHKLKKKKNYT